LAIGIADWECRLPIGIANPQSTIGTLQSVNRQSTIFNP
jgi:hypothetical protein